jgi:hypothetical protein
MSFFGRKKLVIPFGEMASLQVQSFWLEDYIKTFGTNTNMHDGVHVIILGAGYDSGFFSFSPKNVLYFEVYAFGTQQAAKLQAWKKAGVVLTMTGVTYVLCNFECQIGWTSCVRWASTTTLICKSQRSLSWRE